MSLDPLGCTGRFRDGHCHGILIVPIADSQWDKMTFAIQARVAISHEDKQKPVDQGQINGPKEAMEPPRTGWSRSHKAALFKHKELLDFHQLGRR